MSIVRYQDHSERVSNWIAESTPGLSSQALVDLLDLALTRLWARAHVSISEVTLSAVLDRVLHNLDSRFQWVPEISIRADGADLSEFRKAAASLDTLSTTEIIHFILTEFLAIVGKLTGELMTPSLHEELASTQKVRK